MCRKIMKPVKVDNVCTQQCAKYQEMKINSAEIHIFVGICYKGMYVGMDGLETYTVQSFRKLSTLSAGKRDIGVGRKKWKISFFAKKEARWGVGGGEQGRK